MRSVLIWTMCVWLTPNLWGQATEVPFGRNDEGRPLPAGERLNPDLDAWWQDAVFYEIFVRSFADSTEGPLAGDGVGDLRGLIERLDYLNDADPQTDDDLGVTALWLMPITESPSYHGYDTTDYRAIDPEYGTMQDMQDLLVACEARGVRVIIDLVLNHCSIEHPWFQASIHGDPDKRDWFVWRDAHPGWRGPWRQPVWHRTEGGYYYGLFWQGMPDLNFEHEPVTAEMLDIARFWLEDVGVDGFRLDAVRHLIEDGRVQDNTSATHAWLASFYQHVKSINAEAHLVGEVWSPSEDASRYVGDQVDLAFEFWLSEALLKSVREEDAQALLERMALVDRLYPLGMYATFLRNHDQPRTLHTFSGDQSRARLAAAIQFALPGVPYIYYGEEIGMSAGKPDPQIRTPMQWSDRPFAGFSETEPWIDPKPDYAKVNVKAQSGNEDSMLAFYRRLIRVRLSTEALRIGDWTPLSTSDPRVLAFIRRHQGEEVLCLFNLAGVDIDKIRLEGAMDLDRRIEPCLRTGADGHTAARPMESAPARGAFYFPIVR